MSFIEYFKGKELFHKNCYSSPNIINATVTFSSSLPKCSYILEHHADFKEWSNLHENVCAYSKWTLSNNFIILVDFTQRKTTLFVGGGGIGANGKVEILDYFIFYCQEDTNSSVSGYL